MLTIVYRIIALIVVVLCVVNMYKEEKIINQANAALVLVPLVLRLLLIK